MSPISITKGSLVPKANGRSRRAGSECRAQCNRAGEQTLAPDSERHLPTLVFREGGRWSLVTRTSPWPT